MITRFINHRFLDVTFIAVATALAGAWIADLGISTAHWTARLLLFGVALSLAAAAIALVAVRLAAVRKSFQKYVDGLCRREQHEFAGGDSDESSPPLRAGGAWQGIAEQLHQCIRSYRQRLGEADHARVGAEVRSRRAATERQRLLDILSGLSEPIVAVDKYEELILANPSAESLLGIDADGPEKRAVRDLLACEELVSLLTETRRRKAPAQRTADLEIVDAEGGSQWYNVSVRTIASGGDTGPDDDRVSHGAVAVLRDVSNEKDTQKRHAEFVSSVSHEMKTPLAGIKAYVELLVDGDAEDEETREEFLNVINGQADRMQRLIDNLLNIARIEAGAVNVDKKRQSLNDLLEEAFRVVQPAAGRKQIELVNDLSPMYLGVLLDRDMILQAAINLLSNAIKYTPDGGTVTLRSRMQGNQVQFEVHDTGVGLCEEDCKMVFEKFYRVSSNKQMAPGTGLGLPLAQHIVEDVHGGRLTVESTLGEGSTFRATLPGVGNLD